MQQEDEYRLHMELNRCLKKDTAAAGADPDLFESQNTRTVSSRGWSENYYRILLVFFFATASKTSYLRTSPYMKMPLSF